MAELDAAVQARLKEWADLLTAFYEGRDPAQKAWLDQELNRRRAAPHAWRDALLWLTPPRAVDASPRIASSAFSRTQFLASPSLRAVHVSPRPGVAALRLTRASRLTASSSRAIAAPIAAHAPSFFFRYPRSRPASSRAFAAVPNVRRSPFRASRVARLRARVRVARAIASSTASRIAPDSPASLVRIARRPPFARLLPQSRGLEMTLCIPDDAARANPPG